MAKKNKTKIPMHISTKIVYWLFQCLIFLTLIVSIVSLCLDRDRATQIEHIFLCVVALFLYNLPIFIERRFKVYVPSFLHIFALIFIYLHFILGEVGGAYTQSAVFDKILHASSGIAISILGFSLINILNNDKDIHFKLSPFFVAFFAFCFALTIALLWETIEFAADSIFGSNMQRYIPPAALEQETPPIQGYGLIDTMWDITLSTISAFIVSTIGFFLLKYNKNAFSKFLLQKMPFVDDKPAEGPIADISIETEEINQNKRP